MRSSELADKDLDAFLEVDKVVPLGRQTRGFPAIGAAHFSDFEVCIYFFGGKGAASR